MVVEDGKGDMETMSQDVHVILKEDDIVISEMTWELILTRFFGCGDGDFKTVFVLF